MADTDPTSSVPAAEAVSTTPRPSDTQLDTDTVASTPSPAKWAPEDMPTPGDAKRDRARGLEDDLLIPPLNFGRVSIPPVPYLRECIKQRLCIHFCMHPGVSWGLQIWLSGQEELQLSQKVGIAYCAQFERA